ncbi:DUF4232 domain-containing protein [Streptomyces sp. NPDC048111]|uniref:DUF4232 domain-containing protein n=1 Tax=Streptomyces sp. NPDC048111 TaxID=3365500 RepID=UPI00371F8D21
MDRYRVPARRPRRGLPSLGVAVLATLAAATACGGSGTDAQPSSSPPAVTTPPSATGAAPSASTPSRDAPSATGSPHAPAVTSSASSPAGTSRCTADRLAVSLGRVSPGAGNLYVPLVFTNKGTTACALQGFPGVSLLDASGARIGNPAQRQGSALPVVVLAPGKAAYASLHTVNEGVSDKPCWTAATSVQTYPPGSTEAVRLPARGLHICGATFDVSALRPGQGA